MSKSPTIYEALHIKLGREPTHVELREEVRRILTDASTAFAVTRINESRPASKH